MHKIVVLALGAGVIAGSAAVVAGSWSAASANRIAQEQSPPRPWQVGTCYRVFLRATEPPDLFKVVASPEGSWVRVDPDPRAPWVPGARPPARVWLNINTVFVAQEWPCSIFP